MPSCIAAALTAVKSLIVVLLVSARVRGRSAVEEGGDGVAGRFLVRLVLGVRALRADELLVDVLELLLDDAELSVEVLVGPQEGIGGVALPASHQVLDLVAESLLGLVDLARLLLDLLCGLGHFCAINGGVARHGSSIRFRGSSPGSFVVVCRSDPSVLRVGDPDIRRDGGHLSLGSENIQTTLSATTRPSGCCLLYTSPSPRDRTRSRMPSS